MVLFCYASRWHEDVPWSSLQVLLEWDEETRWGFCLSMSCQQVKVEHQRPAGLLQPLEVAEWKWEHVTMDFVTQFPRTLRGYDVVWVIVDRLTKSTHFLVVRMTFNMEEFFMLYIQEIV